jgi:p-cumate 2,3-dioxygenase subunit alpha
MNDSTTDLDLGWAIHEDRERGIFRVNRRVFVDPAVFERERRQIFNRCWLYLAHESELAQPGEFLTRRIAGRPLLANRDKDGQLHVFFNTCPHRGAMVCREDKGRARAFTCPYHGWVFNDQGKAVLRPLPESYSPACRDDPTLNLVPVPRFDVFAGFVFVNFSADGESLDSYLAGAGDYLRNIAAQDPDAMVVVAGSQAYSARANWKLLQENSADGYHAASTHSTYFNYIRHREGAVLDNYTAGGFGRVRNLGNGHAVSESVRGTPWGRPLARPLPSWSDEAKAACQRAYDEMAARLGRERAEWICEGDRNLLIFPNLVVNDIMGLTIRNYYPVSESYFEVSAWALAPKGEDPVLRDLRLRNFVEFLGPAGFATPDDQEMLESCQQAYASSPWVQWNDLSRGMLTEDGPAPAKQDELQMRTFWRRWRELMSAVPARDAVAAPRKRDHVERAVVR